MKKITLFAALLVITVVFSTQKVFAGPPFNNLEGVGGVAFNPLAYLAEGDSDLKIGNQGIVAKQKFSEVDSNGTAILDALIKKGVLEEVNSNNVRLKRNADGSVTRPSEIAGSNFDAIWGSLQQAPLDVIGKPRFGAWYVSLPTPKISWTSFGVADTLFKRLEVSYGHEAVGWSGNPSFNKDNLGAKLLLLKENAFDTKFIPAVSVGTIYKTTSDKSLREAGLSTLRSSGEDWYAVATKTITQLPLPVIISGGVLSSQEVATGVLGFDKERKTTGFSNIDVVLPHGFVVGWEFKQGERYQGLGNHNYWDAHLAWLANKNLTLIAAYTATGAYNKGTGIGLGDGLVLSAQYAF